MTTNLNAHDCFTRANELFSRGHYLDAQTLYDRACELEPNNVAYAEAKKQLQILAASLGHWFSRKPEFPQKESNNNFCTECCCEACGEGGGECCCECLSNCDSCDGCCDGCDCDCG